MKQYFFIFLTATLAFLLSACDKAKEDVLPSTFLTLTLQPDTYQTQVNQQVLISILSNDTITGAANITMGQPQNGTLTAGPEPGQYMYQPKAGFMGTDVFSYTACIEQNCKTAAVTVVVSAVPCELTANPDQDSTSYANPKVINVLANDQLCGTTITLQAGSATIREMVTVQSNNTILFTPRYGFQGVATFKYSISNGNTVSEALVHVKVYAPICPAIVVQPDVHQMSSNPIYTTALDLKALALQNDTICTEYPVYFELMNLDPTPYFGHLQAQNSSSGSTFLYTPTPYIQGVELFQYRLRHVTPYGEVVSPISEIVIYVNI